MPKIIPELGPRILKSAATAFETRGYAATDMKSLASDLGISVGTLYNYYASKTDLFLAVSLLWKEELSARMLVEMDKQSTARDRLRVALLMLYENMDAFTGIWREFMQSGGTFRPGSPQGERFRQDNEQLNDRLQELFREVWRGHPGAGPLVDDKDNRLARIIVGSIMQLVMSGQSDRAGNRAFVEKWIDFIAPPG